MLAAGLITIVVLCALSLAWRHHRINMRMHRRVARLNLSEQ